MSNRKQIKGNKYGHLTALNYVRTDERNCAAIWSWRCDCGNVRELEARVVTAGRTRTCGKCQLKHKIRGESISSTIQKNKRLMQEYQKYSRKAERRHKRWSLSVTDFAELVQKDCHLCGAHAPVGHFNYIEPLSTEHHYTVDGVYIRCAKCEAAYNKISISLLIEQIMEAYRHLSRFSSN